MDTVCDHYMVSNNIETSIKGQNVAFSQSTDYPWNGNIRMTYKGDKNAVLY